MNTQTEEPRSFLTQGYEPDVEPSYDDGLKLGKTLGYEEGYKNGHREGFKVAAWYFLYKRQGK